MLVQRPSWIQIVSICLLGVRATMSGFSTKSLGVDTFYSVDPCALRYDRVASNLQAVDDLRDVPW